MSIAITAQIFNGTSPVNGLADDPEITLRRGDTAAIVLGPVAMTDLGADGLHRIVFTPTDPGLDYVGSIDADPNVTGQVPNGNRYYAVAFDDQVDELYRDRGLDPANVKTTTENTPKVDYTEAVATGGAPISKQSVKAGAVTTTTRT